MKQRLVIAVLTVLVFAAGFFARKWTESGPTVPPPPAPGAEFVRTGSPTPATDAKEERKAPSYSEKDRAKLVNDIGKIRPQIEAYRKRIDEIADEFERDFLTVLTPSQHAKFDADKKKSAERHAKGDKAVAETITLSDEQIFQLQQRPLWSALWNVAINWRLEKLTRDYKLDDQQQAKVREMLRQRRQKFLDLVDSSPPPSITLSQLAAQVEKLDAQPKK